MLIYRGIVLKLLTHRALFTEGFLLQQEPFSAISVSFQQCQPYEVVGLCKIRVAQIHCSLLGIGNVFLTIPEEMYPVIIVVVFIVVGYSGIYIAVAGRQLVS